MLRVCYEEAANARTTAPKTEGIIRFDTAFTQNDSGLSKDNPSKLSGYFGIKHDLTFNKIGNVL